MSVAQFPEFPDSEYEQRVSRARRLMDEHGLDAILLTQKDNIRYFAGGPLTDIFKDPCNLFFVIVPAAREQEPVVMCQYSLQGIARSTWFADRRFWNLKPGGSIIDLSSAAIEAARDVLTEKRLDGATIGIESDESLRPGLTPKQLEDLMNAMPGVTWRSCAPVVWQCRKHKSPREIEKHREACAITCDAIEHALKRVRPGVSERDIARDIYVEMFRRGATGRGFLSVTVGPPRGIWCDATASPAVTVEKGSIILVDGGCTVDGYYADLIRVAAVGKPPPPIAELFDLAYRAQKDAEAALGEGVRIGDVHDASRRPFEKAGFGPNMSAGGFGQLGHGIGLSLHELPDLRRDSDETFSKGMVFAIEPAVSDHPDRGQATQLCIFENNFAITEKGVERLTRTDDEVLVL